MVPPPPRPPTAFVITPGRCPGPYTRLLLTEVTGRSERRPGGETAKGQDSVRETIAPRNRAHGQDSARSFRSSAAPQKSRKKSSLAALNCSLTRPSTKPMLPDPDAMLDEKLELVSCGHPSRAVQDIAVHSLPACGGRKVGAWESLPDPCCCNAHSCRCEYAFTATPGISRRQYTAGGR